MKTPAPWSLLEGAGIWEGSTGITGYMASPSHEVPRETCPGIKRMSRQSYTSLFPNFSSAKLECSVCLVLSRPTFLHYHRLPGLSPILNHSPPK